MLSTIPFSLLELAPMPKGATVSDTLNKSTAYAQKAEELGFNRFWLAEHHNMPVLMDCFVQPETSYGSILICFLQSRVDVKIP